MITVKDIVDEDVVNYKKTSMFIIFPRCNGFKCGAAHCQNSALAAAPDMNVDEDEIIRRYILNPLTHAVVIGGLEPFDTFDDLYLLICNFRRYTSDDIVVYSGYEPDEIAGYLEKLAGFDNIIIKFGRFVPNQEGRKDELLGVTLASPNQRALYLQSTF